MSRNPSNVLPNTTPVVPVSKIVPGMVCGMENPDTRTVEVVEFGGRTEDGSRVGFNWHTGSRRFEGEFADVDGLKLYELTPKLRNAERRFQASRAGVSRCPVPPTPKGFDHSRWLAMNNCD